MDNLTRDDDLDNEVSKRAEIATSRQGPHPSNACIASERNKPVKEVAPQGNEVDCRNCINYVFSGRTIEGHCAYQYIDHRKCKDGDRFCEADPIRLYATGGDSDSTG